MSVPIVEVSNLSKRYIIRHETARATTLRDTLHQGAHQLWQRIRSGRKAEKEEFWALKDINFSINQGEVVGIIGHNGAGKSTLLKCLSRITDPTEGRITLRGRVASLLEVGTGFHPELSGRENIYLNGSILGMSRAEIRGKFDEIVAFAEVEKFLDTPVKRYSSGMYVRLAFAVAAHLEPEILIIDEVLAVGDAKFQEKCLGKMQDVSTQEGRTVFFVSHNLGAINQLCPKSILLNKGTIAGLGATPNIIQLHTATAAQNRKTLSKGSKLKITEVKVCKDALAHGDLMISIYFIARSLLLRPHAGITILNSAGYALFSTNTHIAPLSKITPSTEGCLQVQFRSPPLHTGHYRINAWLGDDVGADDTWSDAARFHYIGRQIRAPKFTPPLAGSIDLAAHWEQTI